MTIIYLVLGALMDELPILIMTVPVFLPIIVIIGYDGIWFGAYVMLCMAMGAIAPPVGLACFVLAGVARDVPLFTIYRGALPFLVTLLVGVLIISVWPQIVTFLPRLMYYL